MKFIYSKTFLFFTTGLIFVVVALFMQAQGWLGPVEYVLLQAPKPAVSVVNSITKPITTVFHTLTSMKAIVKENAQLSTRISDYEQKLVVLDQLKIENELLKQQLGFKSKSGLNLEPCTVLSMDPQNTSDAIILNCGKDNGIQVGQAVVSNNFLVAKVIHVGGKTSTAVLITNSQSSVDAKVARTDAEGVVRGSFGSGLVFDLVSQSADLKQDDLVVTAGIDQNIPKNILIGKIDQTLSGNNDLFKKTTIVSPVRANSVDYVFVVKP